MKFIADLHIHSHYSRATSKDLTPEHLDYWARVKGIGVVGTGDFTHPAWTAELKEKFEPAEEGLFSLRPEYRLIDREPSVPGDVRFMLTSEISCIYKFDGRVRKVHHVICAPDFETVEKIQASLSRIGNITSDGRPILGLDSRDLLEIVLEASPDIFFIPAHVWTPWFSTLGSKSGFDSVEECFRDLSHHIHAVETGLSSDPPMNWMCSVLDRFTLVSNSDAHSPEKLGREANLFDTERSYAGIVEAMRRGENAGFLGTIEFFPQEGKYHFDGHRKCNIRWDPVETIRHGGICSVCGKPVTQGVLSRVAELADRDSVDGRSHKTPFYPLVPLKEILSELLGVGPASKRVAQAYQAILTKGGSELSILREADASRCEAIGGEHFAEAIRRVRRREVVVDEGYDGEYGRVRVFAKGERPSSRDQDSLFADIARVPPPAPLALVEFDLSALHALKTGMDDREEPPTSVDAAADAGPAETPAPTAREPIDRAAAGEEADSRDGAAAEGVPTSLTEGLNAAQREAVTDYNGPALILAGPGTGKTKTLTTRVAHLIEAGVHPASILALTFTNKAATEMRERLRALLADRAAPSERTEPTIATFHAFGLSILRECASELGRDATFSIINATERAELLREVPSIGTHTSSRERSALSNRIGTAKEELASAEDIAYDDTLFAELFDAYEQLLREINAFDLEDLLRLPILRLENDSAFRRRYRERVRWILVDEYQDVNKAQYRLLRTLAPEHDANLCVIGDPNQAIYGFRGAMVRYIREFQTDYPDARVHHLTTSYRCSARILNASTQVLDVESENGLEGVATGVNVRIVEARTDRSEAEFVARTIEDLLGGLQFFSMDSEVAAGDAANGIESLSDFAVLCRTRRQMSTIEKALLDHHVPYQRIDTGPRFRSGGASRLITLLTHYRNPRNRVVALRLAREGIEPNRKLFGTGGRRLEEISVTKALSVLRAEYPIVGKESDDAEIRELLSVADRFGGDHDRFLRSIDIGSDLDRYERAGEKVTLMTLHAAKGLEFAAVFVVGCEDGLLPYTLFRDRTDIEEERRLLYVAMTRAKRYLYLTNATRRVLFGREYTNARSPFLDDIERDLLDRLQPEPARPPKAPESQLDLFGRG